MKSTWFSYVLLRLREDKGFNASAPRRGTGRGWTPGWCARQSRAWSRRPARRAAARKAQTQRDADGAALAGPPACTRPEAAACRRRGSGCRRRSCRSRAYRSGCRRCTCGPSAKVLTVSWQWLPAAAALDADHLLCKGFQLLLGSSCRRRYVWALLALAQAEQSRTGKRPIKPAMSGRMTSTPISLSKARSTASV